MWYWRGGQGPAALSGVAGARVFFLGRRHFTRTSGKPSGPRPPDITPQNLHLTSATGSASKRLGPTRGSRCTSSMKRQTVRIFRTTILDGGRSVSRPAGTRFLVCGWIDPTPSTTPASSWPSNWPALAAAARSCCFPGDAQVASWLSWHEHRWPPDASDAMTCATLLQRTVLYKVSHKGTVPGTPMQFGLEVMTNPGLVAMISVDEAAARERRWIMPAPSVLAALTRSARGRVIRSDLGVPATPAPDSGLTNAEWEQFQRSVNVKDLYIDYQLELPQRSAVDREKSESNWAAANERRVYLVDKKLAGTIRPEEEAELREIERLLEEYMSVTAPTASGLLAELRESVERAKRSEGRDLTWRRPRARRFRHRLRFRQDPIAACMVRGGIPSIRPYKAWLRDEFAFRCVYCLTRELWRDDGYYGFTADHVKPRARTHTWNVSTTISFTPAPGAITSSR